MSQTTKQIIERVLEDIEFTSPVELADVIEVKARIDRELAKFGGPGLPRTEVYHRSRRVGAPEREVVVNAFETFNGREHVTFHRTLEVK